MKFSEYILKNINPEFRGYYIDYEALKSRIHQLPTFCHSSAERCIAELRIKADAFGQLLDFNINRTGEFYEEKYKEYISRLQSVRQRWIYLNPDTLPDICKSNLLPDVTDSSFHETILSLLYSDEELKAVADGIRKCMVFLELNSDAVHRILKKAEKHVLRYQMTSDHSKVLQKMISSDYFIRNRLRPDRNIVSRLDALRIHPGVDLIIEEIRRRCDAIRSLETYWLEQNIIQPEYVQRVHQRRNTLQILTDLHSVVQKTVKKTKWYYGCLAQAKIDYENEPIGEATKIGITLNHYNTFLYLANCYSVIPTANLYAAAVSLPPMISGALLGITSLFAMLAGLIYSIWSNKSFKLPLIWSTLFLICGNFFYAIAIDYTSPSLLFFGRLLIGLGGCRAINRRYIADYVSLESRTFHSALFVAMSSLGMSLGPGAQKFFDTFNTKVPYFGYTLNHLTAASWICVFLWSLYFIKVLILFEEPYRREAKHMYKTLLYNAPRSNPGNPLTQPLLPNQVDVMPVSTFPRHERVHDYSQTSNKLPNSINMNGVYTCLWIYFILKSTQEAFQTAAPMFTAYEFSWAESDIGYFLAIIGVVVFPVNLLVGSINSYMSDRVLVAITLGLLGLGTSLSTNWTATTRMNLHQFYLGALILIISAQCLESVSMSLLSKIMPKSLSIGLWNSGFLSTEAGAFGRVVGATCITVVGLISEYFNNLSVPELQIWVLFPFIICIALTFITLYFNWGLLTPLNDRMIQNIATDADEILASETWQKLPELQPLAVQLKSTESINAIKTKQYRSLNHT